jgi:serine/threonine protein kinase
MRAVMIGTAVSHYLIVGRLGAGGMAVVYEAQDTRLPRRVALKFLHDELAGDTVALARFKREAAALALLNHPNICTIYEVDEFQGRPFIVMERLEGRTLRARLAEGRVEPGELLEIVAQTAQALKVAHEKDIVHRDIKPGNVFITANGVKVLDFGLAKLIDAPETTGEEHTADGRPVGTANYMSPERIRQDDLDPRSDLFSLGVVLFEIAAGFPPFRGETVNEVVTNVLDKDPPPLVDVAPNQPEELQYVVQKLLARRPSDRYQTAGALLRDLKALAIRVQAQQPSTAFGTEPPPVARRAVQTSSVVVMPTRVLAGDADAFLADAIPNAICKYLLKTPGIETKRSPTTGDLERVAGDLDQVASMYRASSYVVSLVNISGPRVALSVQLVDTGSRSLRWCDQYESTREAFGGLMKAAAEGIRAALQPELEPMRTTTAVVAPEAELLLQRGLYYLNLFRNLGRPGDFERAAAALREAVDIEPQRVDAPVAMALLHSARIVTGAPPSEVIPECEKWARRALSVDPRSSKAWAILSEIETMGPDPVRRPLEYGLKAAAFGSRDAFAHARLAGCLMMHSYELSLLAAAEASKFDPLVLDAPIFKAISLNQLNRVEEALATIDAVLEVEPNMLFGQVIKGLILADSGATAPALDIISKLEPMAAVGRLLPQWPQIFKDVAAYHDAVGANDVEALDRLTDRLARLSRGDDPFPRWQVTTSGITRLLAKRSPSLALELFAARALMGIIEPYDYLASHPDLDPLRGGVPFQRMLVTSRRNFEEVIGVVRTAQNRGEAPDYVVHGVDELVQRFELGAAI